MATKDEVLQKLQENKGAAVSGEDLAALCGVSRAAIWKAVKSLREEGCLIEGTTNGGYKLTASDVLSAELLSRYIQKNYPELAECRIECFKEIDSTNTYAKRKLSEAGNLRESDGTLTEAGKKWHKTLIVAESQSAGRGRLGRQFYSPQKSGIYLTAVYAPENGITKPAALTAATAVATCRAIRKLFGIECQIKWINDIFYNAKKICGILVEGFTNFETGTIESAIVGIGINILQDAKMPDEIAKIAGGIVNGISISNVSRGEIAAEVACQVLKIYEEDFSEVLKEYKALNFLIGQTVQVFPVIGDESKAYSALVKDIDENAALIVQTDSGELKHLNSGEVSLKSSYISTQYFPLSANIANI